jgi:putative FmdB family regulatory protein
MPMYDYRCLDCGNESVITLTLKAHETRNVKCPSCGSKRVEQVLSDFTAKTSRKS